MLYIDALLVVTAMNTYYARMHIWHLVIAMGSNMYVQLHIVIVIVRFAVFLHCNKNCSKLHYYCDQNQ